MLHLAIAIGVVVAAIWALIIFPSFRIVALILVALGVGGYFVLNERAEQEQKQQQIAKAQEQAKFEAEQKAFCAAEQKRWTIVSASQIEIRSPSLTPNQSYSSFDDNYSFVASAKNKSTSRVTSLRMNITALDCPAQDARTADCDIVGRGSGTFDANIPAGEVRQISGKVRLPDVPKPRGVFLPRFAISAVRAPLDKSDDTPGNDILSQWVYKCPNE